MKSGLDRQMRSDAQRNRGAIITAAIRTINVNSHATMRDIAEAAGVSRGTLYGHFTSRDALVAEACRWLMADVASPLAALDPTRPAKESLDILIVSSWWVLGHVSGLEAAAKTAIAADDLRKMREESLAQPLQALLTRGRAEGAFRIDQSLAWQTECVYAILHAGASQVRDEQLPPLHGQAEMTTTIQPESTGRPLVES
ncbi:helix-turn-helix domain-containing protein [Cryobacterium sp. PH31-AA6]|uniref:TetR/AcrR family transcriptional regulator n=1 Tax=Cryobacterium sp. PH31-AA6 TaxID=3046205 RepID=UPI0024B894F6|nr:helix-turn-helix domain-containing protein [Cryobacterium sp. PH31-AA6]MDJ0323672.1 helix-turn-helix domain-containing protein [Cryobacterium sp. PH31-AA6]